MALKDDFKRGQTVLMIPPDRIKIKPEFNARDMASVEFQERVASIRDSIEARGFLLSHPIEIFTEGEDIFVSAGHTRLCAAWEVVKRAKVELVAVPCLTEAKGTKPLERQLNQVISNSGTRLSLAEEGTAYKRAMGLGANIPDIAARCGRSVTHVNNALEFLSAPAEVHALVGAGKVSATTAAKTVRAQGAEKATATLKAAADHASAAGRGKARPRDVEAVKAKAKPRSLPVPFSEGPSAGKLAFDLVRKLAKRSDPLAGDFDEELRAFAKLVDEARHIAKGL